MRNDIIPPPRPQSEVPKREQQNQQLLPKQPEQQAKQPIDLPVIVENNEASQKTNDTSGLPPARRSRRRGILIIVALAALLVVAVIAAVGWYVSQLSAVDPDSTEKVKITIEPGSSVQSIATTLQENDLIKSSVAFDWYIRLNGMSSKLQTGTYRLGKAEDVPAIVRHMTSGNTDTFAITFLPGATLSDHRQVLIDVGYEAEAVDAALNAEYDLPILDSKPASADLEGYIYGETYNFAAETTPDQIVSRALTQLQTVVEENDLEAKYREQGFSLFQGITMASIIQREVVTAEDAAQVAQVFKKRYDMGMQLGSDVTYQYIADKTGQARSVDLDSPYNTRRYPGLPPGPISSPGLSSLQAVGSPAPGDFLYFLSGDDDVTYYARTNEEHERNIRDHCEKKCQII